MKPQLIFIGKTTNLKLILFEIWKISTPSMNCTWNLRCSSFISRNAYKSVVESFWSFSKIVIARQMKDIVSWRDSISSVWKVKSPNSPRETPPEEPLTCSSAVAVHSSFGWVTDDNTEAKFFERVQRALILNHPIFLKITI